MAPLADMRAVMEVNYWGTVQITKAFLPFLVPTGLSDRHYRLRQVIDERGLHVGCDGRGV